MVSSDCYSRARRRGRNVPRLLLSPIMVLADLGRKLNAALSSLNRAPVVDDKVLALLAEVRFEF